MSSACLSFSQGQKYINVGHNYFVLGMDWSRPLQVVKPERIALTDNCVHRNNWQMMVCRNNYGKVHELLYISPFLFYVCISVLKTVTPMPKYIKMSFKKYLLDSSETVQTDY